MNEAKRGGPYHHGGTTKKRLGKFACPARCAHRPYRLHTSVSQETHRKEILTEIGYHGLYRWELALKGCVTVIVRGVYSRAV